MQLPSKAPYSIVSVEAWFYRRELCGQVLVPRFAICQCPNQSLTNNGAFDSILRPIYEFWILVLNRSQRGRNKLTGGRGTVHFCLFWSKWLKLTKNFHISCTRTKMALRIYLYNTIQRNVTMEGFSKCVLVIASILFSSYYVLFCNFYDLQCLLLENNIITDDTQRKNTVYAFQLKSFGHNNVILFQVFLITSKKIISGGRS